MSNNNLEQNIHAVTVLSQPEVTKGCTYVLTLGIAHFPANSKDVPHSMIPKLFTRRGLAR